MVSEKVLDDFRDLDTKDFEKKYAGKYELVKVDVGAIQKRNKAMIKCLGECLKSFEDETTSKKDINKMQKNISKIANLQERVK